MRFGKKHSTSGETKVEIQMTPMLDMIFQLLVFFILTFRPVVDEGQFDITMSPSARGNVASPGSGGGPALTESITEVPITIVLRASPNGSLVRDGIIMGEKTLPNMASLQAELQFFASNGADDINVIIEADQGLQYQYVLLAVNAASHAGIHNINFAAPSTP